jgi:hypothetical protein
MLLDQRPKPPAELLPEPGSFAMPRDALGPLPFYPTIPRSPNPLHIRWAGSPLSWHRVPLVEIPIKYVRDSDHK